MGTRMPGTAVAAAAVLVLMVAVALSAWQLALETDRGAAGAPAKPPVASTTGTARPRSLGTELAGGLGKAAPVAVPLKWAGSLYTADVTIGRGAGTRPVPVAFDTGSSQLVVCTDACTSGCAQGTCFPVAACTPVPGCTTTVGYVSQSDNVQMFDAPVSFDGVGLTLHCGANTDTLATALTSILAAVHGSLTSPLVVQGCPVAGVTSVTALGGSTAQNVMGMSSVACHSTGSGSFRCPWCMDFSSPVIESSLLQALVNANQPIGHASRWAFYLGSAATGAGFFCLGTPRVGETESADFTSVACPGSSTPLLSPSIPLVPVVPTAPSGGLASSPYRYYVVRATVNYAPQVKYLILDTGTTQVLLPGLNTGASGLGGNLKITFQSPDGTRNLWTLDYASGLQPGMLANMDAGTAGDFSSALDVGILGCTGMRGLYIEFDIAPRGGGPRTVTILGNSPVP